MLRSALRRFSTYHVLIGLCLLLSLSITLILQQSSPAAAQADLPPATPPAVAAQNQAATTLFLPLLNRDHNPFVADRLGFSSSVSPITTFPGVTGLNAGWYVDWRVNPGAVRPGGMEYMPMVRVHQDLTCPIHTTPDRVACPYVTPYRYTTYPDAAAIASAASASPGLTWLIGNEMDRLDWEGGGQDEMLPEVYARAYKEIRDIIKAADPTAQIAIGGVIQITPMRLEYLTTVWDKYKEFYGTDMPVDVWNIHAFVIAELCGWEELSGGGRVYKCWGAGVPAGETSRSGEYVGNDWKHIDRDTFAKQIRDFRQWMKDRGQQQKPLIVTEYGVLYASIPCNNGCPNPDQYNLENPQVVHDFMLWTFDYFLNTKDAALGYAADDHRLVQKWAWFSLEDVGWDFNPHAALYNIDTKVLTEAGVKFRQYATNNYQALQATYE